VGVTVGLDLVNERAATWAQQYTYDLVKGVTDTSQRQIAQAVDDYYRNAIDRRGMIERIAREFGPERAERIAVTEVTRAAAEGARVYGGELDALGLRTRPIWQTAVDERVCPLCGPRHLQAIEDGMYPPAHPNCRCWVTYEVLPDDQ
jgi:hypothetical protein